MNKKKKHYIISFFLISIGMIITIIYWLNRNALKEMFPDKYYYLSGLGGIIIGTALWLFRKKDLFIERELHEIYFCSDSDIFYCTWI